MTGPFLRLDIDSLLLFYTPSGALTPCGLTGTARVGEIKDRKYCAPDSASPFECETYQVNRPVRKIRAEYIYSS
jgi:hypothetical protein